MILDKLEYSTRYFKSSLFKEIFDKVRDFDIDTPDGTYFSNERYYFKVMTYDTQFSPNIIESHRKEVDVHILLYGKERIKVYKEEDVVILRKYCSKTDCQFYQEFNPAGLEFILESGYMAVFFPNDIHAPLFTCNNKVEKLKKIVIKIDEELFAQL